MQRVLIVSYVFPPMPAGGAVRAGQFAKYLPEAGWCPTVLTVRTSRAVEVDHEAVETLPDEVGIVRAFAPNQVVAARGHGAVGKDRRRLELARRIARAAFVPDRQITWLPDAVRRGHGILRERSFDVVLAMFGPPTSVLVGQALASWHGLPLVVDYRDLWSDLPLPTFSTPLHRNLNRYLEARAVRVAARITCASEGMAAHIASRFDRRTEDVVAIPNGFDPEDEERARMRQPDPSPFTLMHAGSINPFCQDLAPFFTALRALADRQIIDATRVQVEFIGNVDAREPRRWDLEALVAVHPYVPHSRVFDHLARADVLLLFESTRYPGNYSYSSKVFDYLLTGKRILAFTGADSNTGQLVRRSGRGRVVDPDSSRAIQRALQAVVEEGRQPSGDVDPSKPPLCNFNRRLQVQQLGRVLAEATRANEDTPA